ncbi:hypothetical protein [Streptomyces sp. NPDC048419]
MLGQRRVTGDLQPQITRRQLGNLLLQVDDLAADAEIVREGAV